MSGSPPRFLVVGPAWVGDMVMAQSLFMALAQRHPEAVIDVLAPPFTLPLLARMPEVRKGIPMPLGHGALGLATRYRVGRALRREHYSDAIVLPRSFKSALAPFWGRIPRRTGYLGELRYGLLTDPRPLDKQRLPRTVERFVALGLEQDAPLPDPLPLPHLHSPLKEGLTVLEQLGIPAKGLRLMALCPGAEYGPAKQWPLEHFAATARAMVEDGWRVLIIGSPKERAAGEFIAHSAGGGCRNLAGSTTLDQAIDLLALCHAVVSNDSGLMHVAAALGRPVIALFGSSDPHHTPPLSPKAQVLSLGLPCSPCFSRTCPDLNQDLACLRGIQPDRVVAALRQVLA